jgi:hypothetical protein
VTTGGWVGESADLLENLPVNVATGACFGATYPSPFRIDDPNRFQDTSD